MKQTLLTLTTLLITAFTFAYDIQIDGIYYDLNNENQTATVTHDGDPFPPSNAGYNQSKITIPSKITYNNKEYSVTSIGNNAFLGSTSTSSIIIPNSVTKIESRCFLGCTSLISINIPNSVTEIGVLGIEACSSLTSINVDNNNPNYASLDGVLYNKAITTLIACLPLKTEVTIPNSVTAIGDYAFSNCSSLTSITIPNNVTSIGSSAFYCCSSLTSISIPNNVTSIGSYAFHCCSSLTSISIPNSVTSIGEGAFFYCSRLTSITIPNSVTSIGWSAFSSCDALTSITCLGSTPPSANYLQVQYKTCILFVPKGSLNDYQNHTEWGKFQNIQEHQLNKLIISTSVNDDTMGYVPLGGEYAYGTNIILTATAYKGYRFIQWSDGNSDNPRSIIVTKDSTFTAEFALEEFALYATSASPELGYVKHTIEAVAIEGFEFDHWSDGDTKNPRTIILTEDIKLYAYFRMASGGTTTDIETSKIQSAKIYTHNGILHIEDVETDYHVLDASGRLIYTGRDAQLQLPRGVYVIAVDGEVQKIVL